MSDEGGDPACWLANVCPNCGLLVEGRLPETCPRCGETLIENGPNGDAVPPIAGTGEGLGR